MSVAAIVALAASLAPAALAGQIVGTTFPPYPENTDEGNGACIGETLETQCDVALGTLVTADGTPLVIYAGRTKGHMADGKAIWLVTDAIVHPQIGDGDLFALASCRLAGEADSSVLAVAQIADAEFLAVKSWAYRLDRASGKFVKLDPKTVDCFNTITEPD